MIKSLGPLPWHMEIYSSLFLNSLMAGMVSSGADTSTHAHTPAESVNGALPHVSQAVF